MFIVEKFRDDFDSLEESYNRRMKKWVDEGEMDGHNYRSQGGFRRKFGNSPKTKLKIAVGSTVIILSTIAMFALLATYITITIENNKSSQEVKNDN